MQLKDAISTLSFRQKRGKLKVLYTRWGESVVKEARRSDYIPLTEYPRPQMRRKQYEILNGWWGYQIAKGRSWEIPREEKCTRENFGAIFAGEYSVWVRFSIEARRDFMV